MKTIIIYGDHLEKLHDRLNNFIKEARRRDWEILRIDPKKSNLIEKIRSISIFKKKRLFILENIKSIHKKQFDWLEKKAGEIDETLIVFYPGRIEKSIINKFSKPVKIEEYFIPKLVFKFLESFYPGNSQICLKLLYLTTRREPIELIFNHLSRQTRDLYWVKVHPAAIPYPSWRVSKLEHQAAKFTSLRLKRLISKMAQMDIDAKTSKINLSSRLDLFILLELK